MSRNMFFLCSVLICCFISTVSAQGASAGVVRLYRNGVADTNQSWSSGIVQIYYSGQWGNICDDFYFESDEADVICHQLGYSGASSYSNTGTTSIWGTDYSPTVMDDVSCSYSSYLTITQCSFSTSISSYSCTNSDDVIVTCYYTRIWASPRAGDIRLTGGTYSNQGLLEVYCNGQWGTVCDDYFGATQARVACRQLGYNYDENYDHLLQRGTSSQEIFLRFLSGCVSYDDCLTECGGCPSSGISSCSHYEDITLECRYSSSYSKISTKSHDSCSYNDYSTDSAASDGAVRFYRNGVADTSQSWSSGIVQIYYSGQWGNICDDYYFESDEADVICHQLGYTGASSYSNTGTTTTWGTDYSPTVMDDVSCTYSSYLTITQCSFDTGSLISSSCTNSDDVIVSCYSTRIWYSPSAGDIRLTGGNYSNQGLLEVYCNGQWGTVCDDFFGATQARVACRQLGYNYYVNYDHLSQRGTSSQEIFLRFLSGCGSYDDCLTECGGCPSSGISSCSHYEDITLECRYSSSYSKISTKSYDSCSYNDYSTDSAASDGAVRLYRNGVADTSQSWSSGIVQIYYNGQWGNICDDYYFGSDEADVICHQLGYTGASSYSYTGTTTTWGTDYSPTVMDDVSCSYSSYLTITQCSFDTGSLISSSCTNSDDVIVSCYSTRIWDSPSAGDIRLTGGNYSNQGLLEVYCNGQWGTVCDDFFGATQARVACRQLGYNYYVNYDHLSQQGTSSQEIFLDSLSGCGSYDDCLTECGGCPSSGINSCSHSEDITLECKYSSSYSKEYTTSYDSCINYDYSIDTGPIIAAIVGSIIGFIVCIIVIITVPICICVCLGVGIGAASRSGTRSQVVSYQPLSTPTTTVVTQDVANATAGYPAQPETQDTAITTAGYPTQPGTQNTANTTAGYPTQPAAQNIANTTAGYPTQPGSQDTANTTVRYPTQPGAQQPAYYPADPNKPATEYQPPPPLVTAGYGPPPEYTPYQPTPANIPQQGLPGQEQIV